MRVVGSVNDVTSRYLESDTVSSYLAIVRGVTGTMEVVGSLEVSDL